MQNEESKTPTSDVEGYRRQAIRNVQALARQSAPMMSGSQWGSYTGYHYGRWAARGFHMALGLLEKTPPGAGETGEAYLRRVAALVRERRDEYRQDAEDEDGACSGALDAAMWAITDAIPTSSP